MIGWNRFMSQLGKDLKLWFFCLAFLSLFRIIFILNFSAKISPDTDLLQILNTILYGIRFDSMVAGYTLVLPFLLTLTCNIIDLQRIAEYVRHLMGSVFIVLSVILFGTSLVYFEEYNDQFNHFFFGLIYDDTDAIIKTIWKEYNPVFALFSMSVVLVPTFIFKKRLLNKDVLSKIIPTTIKSPGVYKIPLILLILLSFILGMRGYGLHRPAQRRDAYIVKDNFLNKVVLNPHMALKYAIKDHLRLTREDGLKVFLPDEDLMKASTLLFSNNSTLSDLDSYMLKYAKGPVGKPSKHVFLFVMESYDSWPLLDKYSSLGLTNGLRKLANEGIHIESFLPSSSGTMTSLSAILTGLADAGLETSLQKTAMKPYPSSIAETFNRLGYKTRFFYGGKLSWRRCGSFARAQGFKEVYGAGSMGDWTSANEWGVDDEYLFDFISKTVKNEEASLNVIMSTSYHPPYDIDVYEKGFKHREIPPDLKDMYNGSVDLKVFGHLWYADLHLEKFVKKMETKLNAPLFAITGDHSGRMFLNDRPDFFESSAVPFVLYGKEVLNGILPPKGVAGSHIDIMPTLIELTAPKGFNYYSIGRNLLDPEGKFLGIAKNKVIGENFIASLSGNQEIHPLPGKVLPSSASILPKIKSLHDAAHGVSWWRIKKGSVIK